MCLFISQYSSIGDDLEPDDHTELWYEIRNKEINVCVVLYHCYMHYLKYKLIKKKIKFERAGFTPFSNQIQCCQTLAPKCPCRIKILLNYAILNHIFVIKHINCYQQVAVINNLTYIILTLQKAVFSFYVNAADVAILTFARREFKYSVLIGSRWHLNVKVREWGYVCL